jgi:3-hydroxy-9,10-secoandrosta-1,3,5(10)-triene-9,17-dione monooxygenase reductase component
VAHRIGTTGAPLLDGTVGHLDCRLTASHEAGDHVIFIGEVLALEASADATPLLFHGGQYCLLRT